MSNNLKIAAIIILFIAASALRDRFPTGQKPIVNRKIKKDEKINIDSLCYCNDACRYGIF